MRQYTTVFMSVSVLPAFLEEKAVFVRERANGGYSVAAFVVAHTVVGRCRLNR